MLQSNQVLFSTPGNAEAGKGNGQNFSGQEDPATGEKPKESGRRKILCYGDSLTAGLCNNCSQDYEPYAETLSSLLGCPVDHIGLSGWSTGEMVSEIDSISAMDVKDRRWSPAGLRAALGAAAAGGGTYTGVILMGGTNDLTDVPARRIVDNLLRLRAAAADAGAAVAVLAVPPHAAVLGLPPPAPASIVNGLRKAVEEVNTQLKEEIESVAASQPAGRPGVHYVDPHAAARARHAAAGGAAAAFYGGFPTLRQFTNEYAGLRGRAAGFRPEMLASAAAEDMDKPLNETAVGEDLKKQYAGSFHSMQDGLHFSAAGYKHLAHTLAEEILSGRLPL